MLVTSLRNPDKGAEWLDGACALICTGCREVFLPEDEISAFIEKHGDRLTGVQRADYLCEEQWAAACVTRAQQAIAAARSVVVFSCGVGVQSIARQVPSIPVVPGCDTHFVNGFAGLTPQEADCRQCGECFLNITGGICPLTACAKGLLNGPCGGAKDGKCEVDSAVPCGWERIWKRLSALGLTATLSGPVRMRDFRKILVGIGTRKERA